MSHLLILRVLRVVLVAGNAAILYIFYAAGGWLALICGSCLMLTGYGLGAFWNDVAWVIRYEELSLDYARALHVLELYAEAEKQNRDSN